MFDELTTKLAGVFRKLTDRGKLSEQDVRDGVREIRRVLLEADVNLAVARDLCKRVEERAIGTE
ncbi:MAG TPA: signal recognition particle receptor subunit alpha, partial [Candidatus Eisenbacteria bacterium]|nr:signal recognition particle receptor subunit alpha [Candidatus Eisenbacteria bacterium]